MNDTGKKIFFGNNVLKVLDKDIEMDCKNIELIVYGIPTSVKTIFAAGGLVYNESGELLIINRYKKWDLPKGQIKMPDETPQDAAVREVKEETGLKHVIIGNPLPSTYHVFEKKGKWNVKRTFWYVMQADKDQQLIPQLEEDIQEVRWIKPADIPFFMGKSYASLQDLFMRLDLL
jgi:8-oxo-(d)GTP phosphatase